MSINNETPAALEAILFACGSPVPFERLCEILCVDAEGLRTAAAMLSDKYSDDRKSGITLVTIENSYQLCTKAYVADYVKKALEMRKTPPLSKAALEVLAIVASLCEKGLITERGTLDAPGRPTIFGTTDAFLRCFGLESIAELPKAELAVASEQISLENGGETNETTEKGAE